jgi:hypothetical protein
MAEMRTVKELAQKYGCHQRTVRWKCEHYGIPIENGLVDADEYAQAVDAGNGRTKGKKAVEGKGAVATRLDAQTRKIEIEGRLLELKLMEREGELVERKAVAAAWSQLAVRTRSDILALSSRLATDLHGKSIGQIKETIDREAHRILRHWAKEPELKGD